MLAAISIVVGCLIPAGKALIIPRSLAFSSVRGIFHNGHTSYYDTSTTTTALDMRTRRRRRKRPRRGIKFDIMDEDDDSCQVLDRADHQGLAKSIDEEYALEEAKLGMTFWEVLERERARPLEDISEKSRDMSPWDRAKRRMNYAKGNTESKYTLMAERSYGEAEILDQDHLTNPPSLDDINRKPSAFKDSYWSAPVFRIGVIAAAYFAFPLFLRVFYNFQTIDPDDFDTIVGQIAPNVGVLYATILALTLQVLYDRFTRIQENVTTEAMLLSQVTRNLLSLFANDKDWAIESCQMVANQVRMMISRTRGVELLSIMKADTYANLLNIVDDYHYLHGCDDDYSAQEESITGMLRGEIGQLMEVRALRLSDEASSLPPTHFLLITSLSFVSIVAYVTASLKVVEDVWHPPQEASLLFAGLLALYILFFNFCKDLNGPFAGVYQIKRSNAISHLMQTKWLIVNQLGDEINFDTNYGLAEKEPEPEEKRSMLDNVKGFFSGSTAEDIATVEADAMETLVEELETAVETIGQEGDLCVSLLPEPTSLDCTTEEGRLKRLHQMEAELARLKDLNRQISSGKIQVSASNPETRLQNMQKELSRLKQLSQSQVGEVAVVQAVVKQNDDELLAQAEETFKQEQTKILEEEAAKRQQEIEAKIIPLTDKATGVTFDAKLDAGLYLVGVGVRKKAIINVYAVAMYSSPAALEALSPFPRGKQKKDAQTALLNSARTFGPSSPQTTFVLEMTFKADGATIGGAIAEGVQPRYNGSPSDVKELEALIIDGVKNKGGQATKGTIFRFDCTQEGVKVSVDGNEQGMARFDGIGSALVDVFMDDKAVSPQLVDSCLDTWCGSNM